MKKIITVAGIIYNEKGEILCTEREVGKYEYTSLKWEFPGGKIEAGENDVQALERELSEELDISVQIKDKFYQVEHDYPDFHLSMAVYTCKLLSHKLKMNVHRALKWVRPESLLQLEWAGADLPVANKIVENCLEKC